MLASKFEMANSMSRFVLKQIVFRNSKRNIFQYVGKLLSSYRCCSSAVPVSSNKSKELLSFLMPHLDFDERLTDKEKLQNDLVARGLDLDVNEINKMWEFYKSISARRHILESKCNEIATNLTPLFTKKDLTPAEEIEFTKLKTQIQALKQELKEVKIALQSLNESVLKKLLELPNAVDGRTPTQSPRVLKRLNSINELSDSAIENHIEIGKRLGLLEYRNPMQYYLCNDAALFELGILNYAGQIFNAENMIRVAGADFSRSVVIQGSGLNHEDPTDAFIIDRHSDVDEESPNRMHLVGGASLISFLTMHTKQLINTTHLPVNYFSTGRQYTPFRPGSTPIGLFTVCQTSAVVAFTLVKNEDSLEYQTQFEKLVNIVCKLYDSVCNHYQVIVRPASELRPWESMRVSFELWSTFSKQYIEVGHVSLCGTYFSKRLQILCQEEKDRTFPAIISGTVLSVPRLLGCLLEENPEKFTIPPKILEHSSINYKAY